MNILWISPTPSHPQDAGNRAHIYAMGKKMLAHGHKITFLLYGQESVSAPARAEMQEFWTDFVFVPKTVTERRKTCGNHWGIDDWFKRDIEIAVEFVRSQKVFDIVYCEYVFFSKALTYFPKNSLKVLNCHDRMSGRAEMLVKNGIEPDFFYVTPEHEAIALNRADLVLAIQEEECRYFEILCKKPVLEVNYPFEIQSISKTSRSKRLRIGYMASGNSLNRKSIETFIEQIRSTKNLSSQITLVLAGTICSLATSYRDLEILPLGIVEKEKDFYEQIDIVVNPMIDGTGLKIKTVSAIQHGVPFLSTVSGSAGINTTLPEHSSSSISEMVDHVENLVQNPKRLTVLESESTRLLKQYIDRSHLQLAQLLRCFETSSTRHMRKKKVLVVTDRPFWEPGLGSHARISSLCKELDQNSELIVFFLGSLYDQRRNEIKKAGFECQVVSFKSYEEAGRNIARDSNAPKYETLRRWRHHSFFRSLCAYLQSESGFDVVIIEYIWLAYLEDAIPKGPLKIIDTHDLMSYREYRFSQQGLKHHISLTLAQEKTLLERFDVVLAIQDEEARKLTQVLERSMVLCCPHGLAPTMSTRSARPDAALVLGFVGGNSDANYEAINWFIQQVWPVVSQFGVLLNIFGSVCSRLEDVSPGITRMGLSNDLSVIYDKCDVFLNPIIQGGGIKIKSVEALAHGKALIASPEGVVGIRDPENCGIIVARTRGEFIDAVLDLVRNPRKVEELGDCAFEAAQQQFEPTIAFSPLTKLIAEL